MRSELPSPLLLITDRAAAQAAGRPLREVIAAALEAGCRWVLLREKDLSPAALASLAADLLPLITGAAASLSISGDAGVARACGARGVHLPQGRSVTAARAQLGPAALIGVSAHSLDEARAAADSLVGGADYVTLSPIFASLSKPGYGPAIGLAALGAARATLDIPIIALGGVAAGNCQACLDAGAQGVAMMGAVMRARDPGAVVRSVLAGLAPQQEQHDG